ncbi:hypothetical protein CP533_2141 [Ophiocordyceps camponoti-saundersi (nom. inval.)]|nr:hypothetical protein CP533_2141 [Ophiocordyceps camponoti-saundersi (nom. inval.)]
MLSIGSLWMPTPLDERLTETVEFFGRTFQKYALENGIYFAPIDEASRPCPEALLFSPRRILDCGCGSGDWAVDVARRFPDCEVLGIDISPHIMPEDGPNNLEFQIDDLNGRFTFPSDHFDLVHSQMVAGGIHANRWRSYIQDMIRVLRPGGWCQMVEVYFNAQSDNGTLERDHALSRWSRDYLDTMHRHKDPRAAMHLASWMRSEGFTEVESRLLTLPMCAWPSEAREQRIGTANSDNVAQLLYSLALYPLIQLKGMSQQELNSLVERARTEAGTQSLKVTRRNALWTPRTFSSLNEANSSPPLFQKIRQELKSAMRAGDKPRLNALRSIMSANTNAAKTDKPITSDVQLVNLIRNLYRMSSEAAIQAKDNDRPELAAQEQEQMDIYSDLIANSGVETLDEAKLKALVGDAVAASKSAGTAAKKLMGDVMKRLSGTFEGKDVDMKLVARLVQELTV